MPTDQDLARLAAALKPLTSRVRTDVTARRSQAGHQSWTREPLTDDAVLHHLNGGPARGVCPIKADETVTQVAVLDFDDHTGAVGWGAVSAAVARVVECLELAGFEPILFRSGGGKGAHLYLLWEQPQDAYSVRQQLKTVLASCDLRPGARGLAAGEVEVFPKQDRVAADGFGSQFILPLSRESVPLALSDEEDFS